MCGALMFGSGTNAGSGAFSAPRSSPVSTRRTPGTAFAASALIDEDPGVGVRAAQERGLEHVGQVDVVDVAPAAAQEALVLDAREGRADVPVRELGGHAGEPPAAAASW